MKKRIAPQQTNSFTKKKASRTKRWGEKRGKREKRKTPATIGGGREQLQEKEGLRRRQKKKGGTLKRRVDGENLQKEKEKANPGKKKILGLGNGKKKGWLVGGGGGEKVLGATKDSGSGRRNPRGGGAN